MKKIYPLLALLLSCWACDTTVKPSPPLNTPVEIFTADEADGEDKENSRERWEEAFHRAAPGTNWRSLEAHNAMARHRKRRGSNRAKGNEFFADGLLSGEWFERGSKFTAGSVFDVVQDPEDPNQLFLMSAGGAIWRMDYAAEEYSLVNHDIYFDGNYLGMVPVTEGRQLVAFSNDRPMYSPNDGESWEFATVRDAAGQDVDLDQVRGFFSPQVVDSILYTSLSIGRDGYRLFRSADGGKSYDSFAMPPLETDDGDQTITHLYSPVANNRFFVLMKKMYDTPRVKMYELGQDSSGAPAYTELATLPVTTTDFYRSRLTATVQPGTDSLRMYLQADNQLFRSDNDGQDWREMPTLEKTPWRQQSIYVRPSDPDFVAYGAVELWVSRDGGETFAYPNRWFDYYTDPSLYLHADIMRLTEIKDPAGGTQLLVSNHGGLNQLNPADSMWYSIAREGLNVAQYYDVRTNPGNPSEIYAGSQDQGFQVLNEFEGEQADILGGYQWFSGDYGHIDFAEEGNVFFTAYPFGLVYGFYGMTDAAENVGWMRYELESPDEFTWITPMMSPPREDERVILYMAGGSADTARNGSFLVAVEMDRDPVSPTYGEATATDKPFDFRDAAAGNITAMTYSPLNPNRFYVATEQGRFFASGDAGENWEETLNFLPQGWYLYGQAIHASKTEAETVWLGGSGYSNPPVWRSTDGGENFFPASDGLPPTVVHGLAANTTESLVFAATEAGPFVYVASEERWFDLTGQFAPTMRYYSVEFLEDRQVARFGTYGRGAWDFQIDELVSTPTTPIASERLAIYPNPASGFTTVAGQAAGYRLYDVGGREVRRVTANTEQTQLSLTGLVPGLYFVQPLDAQGRAAGLGQRLVVR